MMRFCLGDLQSNDCVMPLIHATLDASKKSLLRFPYFSDDTHSTILFSCNRESRSLYCDMMLLSPSNTMCGQVIDPP